MRDKQPVSPSADNDGTYVCADCGGTGIDSERSRKAGDLVVCRWYDNPGSRDLCNGGEAWKF